ncbi:MAG: sensor histidine kinase [Firmicutes bacterium HGW-Firmicutes-1]|nr:MAG: sensor histidine kinase [Firmicutes bacterium HGW-Firmicutes-1]
MDTKLKNIKYALGSKIIATVLALICFIGATGSGIYLLYHHEEVITKSYLETSNFQREFTDLLHNIIELKTVLIDEETIKASNNELYMIQDNLKRLKTIENNISGTKNFFFLIQNTKTNDQMTNVTAPDKVKFIQNMPMSVYFNELESNYTTTKNYRYQYYFDFNSMLAQTNYEIYASIQEPLQPGDIFYDSYVTYNKIKDNIKNIMIIGIVSFVTLLGLMIYLFCVAGRREKGGHIHLIFIDKIYTDMHSLLVLLAAIISVGFVGQFSYYGDDLELIIITSMVLSIDFMIGLSYLLSMIRQIKNKQLITNSLFYVILKAFRNFIKMCFNGKVFKVWLMLLLLAYGGINSIVFALSILGGYTSFFFGTIFLIGFNTVVLIFLGKSLVSLSKIMEATKEISKGNLDYKIDSSKISVAFSSFAEDVQSLQIGLKKAVIEAVKGERMKTDLITNVSHDLKTPLTSIITYVDLLKKEELKNEIANGYVEILEEKSNRLKNLVEDLVEASKASSGNLIVTAEKVDLHELMLQACGEYEELIKASELDIRINSDLSTLVSADGKYMWRIVENLMSNVIKYSLKSSRVYIDIIQTATHGQLTVKNISAMPLDISPEQLTERFVRGEVSRTTEGSGLGLSIAQSLTTLQGGTFKIEIDGDLYKAIVALPLWHPQLTDIEVENKE